MYWFAERTNEKFIGSITHVKDRLDELIVVTIPPSSHENVAHILHEGRQNTGIPKRNFIMNNLQL